ncbi:MAG: hypothetical protein U9Q61_01915 [Thermodesulfobacteriota bacterium]|nr:hypothetical protein [Thermodesulfobacteriota bacterium]
MNRDEAEKISADMLVLDVVSEYPETEAVFKSYDERVGECICCQRLFETVQKVAEIYNLNLAELLAKLNSALED